MKKKIFIAVMLVCAMLLSACSLIKSGSADGDQEPAAELQIGTYNASTYQNAMLGCGATLEGWNYADYTTLAKLNNWTAEAGSEEFMQVLAEQRTFIDMSASAADQTRTVNVTFNRMDKVYGGTVTEQNVVDQSVQDMPNLLAQAGYSDVQIVPSTVPIANEEHPGVLITGTVSGVAVFQKQAFIQRGDYIVTVTATSFNEDHTDEILSQFYHI